MLTSLPEYSPTRIRAPAYPPWTGCFGVAPRSILLTSQSYHNIRYISNINHIRLGAVMMFEHKAESFLNLSRDTERQGAGGRIRALSGGREPGGARRLR